MSMHTTNVTKIIAAGDCDDCGNRYQVAAIKSNGDQGVDVRCPHCGSIHFAREFESFFENVDEEHQPSVVKPAGPDWLVNGDEAIRFDDDDFKLVTDGGHSKDDTERIARCTKCDARLAVLQSSVDADEIPLCQDCFEEEMPESGGESA